MLALASSRGPARGSKRGSRACRRVSGMISRRRETGRFEDCSWGACLEERLGVGSFFERVGLRGGGSSLRAEVSAVAAASEDLDLRWEGGSEAWAFARAPKEMEVRSTLGAAGS